MNLFDCPSRPSDPATSHEAAQGLSREQICETQRHILDFLSDFGPMTDEQLLVALRGIPYHISPSGARGRRSELVRQGLVRDSGRRGETACGRKTIVWEAVQVDPRQ